MFLIAETDLMVLLLEKIEVFINNAEQHDIITMFLYICILIGLTLVIPVVLLFINAWNKQTDKKLDNAKKEADKRLEYEKYAEDKKRERELFRDKALANSTEIIKENTSVIKDSTDIISTLLSRCHNHQGRMENKAERLRINEAINPDNEVFQELLAEIKNPPKEN